VLDLRGALGLGTTTSVLGTFGLRPRFGGTWAVSVCASTGMIASHTSGMIASVCASTSHTSGMIVSVCTSHTKLVISHVPSGVVTCMFVSGKTFAFLVPGMFFVFF
jgi:hypothetical protein